MKNNEPDEQGHREMFHIEGTACATLKGERGHGTLGVLQKISVSQGYGTEWYVCVGQGEAA